MKKYLLICFFLLNALSLFSGIKSFSHQSIKDTYQRLLINIDFKTNYINPPLFEIVNDTNIMATSTVFYNSKFDNYGYSIKLSTGLLNTIVQNDSNLLAFIICHELAHINLGHLESSLQSSGNMIGKQLRREDEYDADQKAISIAADAGYNLTDITKSISKMLDLGYNEGPLFCLNSEHPTWSDRLERIDKNHKAIWQSVSSFKNGNTFMSLSYYKPAIYCFNKVIQQFPDCYEAHINIGYAKLMSYIEMLDIEDLKKMNVGHLITGIYYNEANSIKEKIRGADYDLWWDAVGEFQLALKINPNQTLANANLGLAYLVTPLTGTDIGKSAKYFHEALTQLEKDTLLPLETKAAVYLNAGVSYLYAGLDNQSIEQAFNIASDYGRRFSDFSKNKNSHSISEILNGIDFNKAVMLMKHDDDVSKKEALKIFDRFLNNSNKESPWWSIGNEYRKSLSKELNINTNEIKRKKTKQDLSIKGIKVTDKVEFWLSDRTDEVLEQLKGFSIAESKIIPNKDLKRIKINDKGIELLASEYLFAIVLNKEYSKDIELSRNRKSNSINLRIGMTRNEVDKLFDGFEFITTGILPGVKKQYRYYEPIGISLYFNPNNDRLEEIIISHLK